MEAELSHRYEVLTGGADRWLTLTLRWSGSLECTGGYLWRQTFGKLTFSVGSMLVACRPKVRRRTTGAALVE